MASSNGSLGNGLTSNNWPSNNRLGNNSVHEPPSKTNHRCRVMGVVNVTPDLFTDGGLWDSTEAAVKHGLRLWNEGTDVVDIGGESTRPGAARIDERVELDRILPVVAELARNGVKVSTDTTRASVAKACIGAGAWMINDVSGGLSDSTMLRVIADLEAPCVIMHCRAPSATMNDNALYTDVVVDVGRELQLRVNAALAHGIEENRIVLDPGLGFALSNRSRIGSFFIGWMSCNRWDFHC